MKRPFPSILLIPLSWALVPAWAPGLHAQTPNQEILKRLELIEKRLEQIEKGSLSPAPADGAGSQDNRVGIEELRRQVDVLAEELEKVRSGEGEYEVSSERAKSLGLGSSAAAVYRKRQGVSLAGYGEMLYQNFSGENERGDPVAGGARLDFLRGILYAGYRFNDKFLFNSEIEFEHASTDKTGSASVEFAYIDYLASKHVGLRGGLLLMPMGLTNELHEPTAFIGARRSETETVIIPSTWRENGFGVVGSAGIFDFRAYLVNGLDATEFSSSGLRGGRQKGSQARATDLAFVGRLDVNPTPGVFFGGSFYRGGSGQGQVVLDSVEYDVTTTIAEVHAQVQLRGVDFRGLFARARVEDAAQLNRFLGLSPESAVAERLQGGYLQFGYNVLNEFRETVSLMPFFRFEKVDTQHSPASGFLSAPSREQDLFTLGLEFKPIRHVVLKSDFQWIQNGARTGVNQFNLGLGYAF